MALKRISDYTTTALAGTEMVELETAAGASGKCTVHDIANLASSASAAPVNAQPSVPWFAPSSVTVVAPSAGQPAGDPFIVWDSSASLFRMFYFHTPSGVATYTKTAPTLEGPWSAEAAVTGLTNYHKFVVLVDAYGNPVQIGGTFHGYAVYYDGTNTSSKTIYHFTAASLGGAWTLGSNVIPKGASGSWDGYANDACFALYDSPSGTIYLWYMAEPNTSQTDFGLSSRIMLATSTAPDSGFSKNYTTAALSPGTTGAWDAGWLGGMQVRKLSATDPYVMFYNAGNTVPSTAGAEPDTSLIGYAYASSLSGPWTKYANNPTQLLVNLPSTALEKTDLWRSHLAFDPTLKRWALFYNTSSASGGGELVTFARANVYDYQYYPGASGDLLTLSTSEQQVPNSMVNVQPGVYRFRAQINIIGDSAAGTLPKLNVTMRIRQGGATQIAQVVDFIGSYAYENRDSIIDSAGVVITAPTYLDVSLQVTAGTPVAGSHGRNLRMVVEKL